MILLNQVKLNINFTKEDFIRKVSSLSRISNLNMDRVTILKKSIDARDKKDIHYVFNVAIDYEDKNKFNPIINDCKLSKRPIIVGFGPAGIFAAYIFALNGIKPIVIERGKKIEDRESDVEKFLTTLSLDCESNVSFGEGGAGAFSDGKLNTNNKDKTGVYRFVLETFVKFGADQSILYENMPHIGTDKLKSIIINIREEIMRLGGEIHYSEKFTYDKYKDVAASGTPILLAIGNSSRDTFIDLYKNGFDIKAKAFAVGFRVAHLQDMINTDQYGDMKTKLSPASYKLTYDAGRGKSVYSFCMCPGGYIINSSNYKNKLSINGMSYNKRSGLYANSAIVETITPEDLHDANFLCDEPELICMRFQEEIEKRAFELEDGYIPYFGEKINECDVFKGLAKFDEKIFDIYENLGLKFSIRGDIENALAHFEKILPGFDSDKKVIAGVETRTSSPVMLKRDENFMCNVKGFFPIGEGLGHGGGIMSCAVDGINAAKSILLGCF